jgi:hypothetical protein
MLNSIYMGMVDVLGRDEQSRVEVFRTRWEAYYGKMPKPLKVEPGRIDDNVRLNYARMIVDKGVSFLFGKDVGFELDETAKTTAEEWLTACWTANKKMTMLQNLALVGGVTGHAFVKIVTGSNLPRLVVLDPETVTVGLAPDDRNEILNYQIAYGAKDPKTGKPISVRQVIERDNSRPQGGASRWHITDQIGDLERLSWTTINDEVWPYPFSPIVDSQNLPAPGEFWGTSDLEEDILEIVQAINFTASNTARIIRFHAHPKTWGRGFQAKDLKVGVDDTIILPNEKAELHNLEMQSDLASSLAMQDKLKQALCEISRVPEVAAGNLDRVGALSGLALQILYQPLLEKTETKRLLYGDLLTELNRRLLASGGLGDDLQTVVQWQEVLPKDPLQERQAAMIDRQLGVSDDTLLTRFGYSPDLERQKKQNAAAALGEGILSSFDKGE